MANNKRTYKAILVLDTQGSEDSADALTSKVSEIIAGMGGEVKKVENLGLRDLVRPQSKDLSNAAYVKIDFESDPDISNFGGRTQPSLTYPKAAVLCKHVSDTARLQTIHEVEDDALVLAAYFLQGDSHDVGSTLVSDEHLVFERSEFAARVIKDRFPGRSSQFAVRYPDGRAFP